MKKRMTVLLLALITAFTAVFSASCGKIREVPGLTDEEARARLKEILPAAREIMRAAYGEGLLPEEDAEPKTVSPEFFPVREGEAYSSAEEMKKTAETIFSASYLRDTLFILLFDGYYRSGDETGEDEETAVTGNITPRYVEEDGVLKVDVNYVNHGVIAEPMAETATVISGNASAVKIELSYRLNGEMAEGRMRIGMVQENGNWVLDGPVF